MFKRMSRMLVDSVSDKHERCECLLIRHYPGASISSFDISKGRRHVDGARTKVKHATNDEDGEDEINRPDRGKKEETQRTEKNPRECNEREADNIHREGKG